MSVDTGLPSDLREYLDFSMATQAEGLKFGIEHYRRRQPHNSGTLVWRLNDAWPGFSWSIVDYDLTPKPATTSSNALTSRSWPASAAPRPTASNSGSPTATPGRSPSGSTSS